MAVVARRQPSALVSNGLSAATVALNIAGAATDAVPIVQQILNSAAHISAVAEKIQKKREAMYTLVEKADIYAAQINIAVAGRILDPSLQRRLDRLYSVFLKIEELVDTKAGSKNNALIRAWRNVVTKPNRAEALVAELEREIQLFHAAVDLSLEVDNTARAVDDTARAVAADARYDGQFRILRDCEIVKLDVIDKRQTDEGVVVWASARVKRELMVIRYLESQPNAKTNAMIESSASLQPWTTYAEYLENVKKVSTVCGSHPNIIQLYGYHSQGPEAVLRAGTFPLWSYLNNLRPREGNEEDIALKQLTLAYKILHASAHLESVHRLTWIGTTAIVDENGEPRIGLFDDIVRANPGQPRSISIVSPFYYDIFNYRFGEETGVIERVHDSSLHAIVTELLRHRNDTDRLQRVWGTIRQEPLHVKDNKRLFPVISEKLPLSQESIARARLYFETNTKEDNPFWNCVLSFTRHVLAECTSIPSRSISILPFGDEYEIEIEVQTYTHDDCHIRYDRFNIYIPAGSPFLADIVRAAGLPDDFERSCSWDGSITYIWFNTKVSKWRRKTRSGIARVLMKIKPNLINGWGSSEEEEEEEYETADEGDTSSDAARED